jgi:hypothetical protein
MVMKYNIVEIQVGRLAGNDSHGKRKCLFCHGKNSKNHGLESCFLVNECLETEDGNAEFIIDSMLYT